MRGLANDVSKYFAIIPAAFATTYPELDRLNVMRLASPASAILAAVIFNAQVQSVIDQFTEVRTLGLLGEPRVSVLHVNLALEELR